jgi:hypothetical protein
VSLVDERRQVSFLEERRCAWCRSAPAPTHGRFCSRKCRQTAFRLRRRGLLEATATDPAPKAFAYADPPYLGLSSKYYRRESTFAGEVDHVALVSLLQERHPDGWALSASARSLATLLPMCPPGARVCAWVKPHGASPQTYGLHNCWEPLIVVGGRQLRPGVRDWLSALPARGGGELPGRKPIAFCAWLFRCLGMQPGDTLADLFPGTGVVSRAWAELSASPAATGGENGVA